MMASKSELMFDTSLTNMNLGRSKHFELCCADWEILCQTDRWKEMTCRSLVDGRKAKPVMDRLALSNSSAALNIWNGKEPWTPMLGFRPWPRDWHCWQKRGTRCLQRLKTQAGARHTCSSPWGWLKSKNNNKRWGPLQLSDTWQERLYHTL